MKKLIKYFALAGLGIVALSSCDNEKFLDVPKYDILDISTQFEGDDNARLGLNGIYAYNNVSKEDNSWGYKPNLFTGSHPTMDTQCTGWDVKFLDQTWDANVGELGEGWSHAYAAICRANLYLTGLETAEDVSPEAKKLCEGEARALRGYFYTWLATTFGRVPMLATGEDFNNTPEKAAAETYEEMWDFIIEDFQAAANLLDWTPYNGQYGRCTKGMAKAYLADAYMWKAFRCPEVATDCYNKAKAELKSIIDSGTYKLVTNFATNWDPAGFWNDECVWAMCSDEGNEWSSWGADRTITFCNPNMFKWFTACPENGGWGSQYLSWEWYACYEKGDTRRDASCATGAIDVIQMEELYKYANEDQIAILEKGKATQELLNAKKKEASDLVKSYDGKSMPPSVTKQLEQIYKDVAVLEEQVRQETGLVNHGFHPYLKTEVGNGTAGTMAKQFHFTNGEFAPAIWTTKIWRNANADSNGNSWGFQMWSPTIIYGKRYANVLLDYAECCFRTGDENAGWAAIDEIRNRAWGNLTIGQDYSKYFAHFNNVYEANGQGITMTEYPVGVLTEAVTVPSAKEYYTMLQAKPNRVGYTHTSEVWKVAVNEERRKEFNSEWCLCPDMIKSGYMEDHINYNYPKDDGGSDYANYPWSKRSFDFDIRKMDMPIPATELMKNSLLKQNPAYAGN